MTDLRIGRFRSRNVAALKTGADGSMSVNGILRDVETVGELKGLRAQLRGHVDDPDAPVVPVTFDDDPSLDGFYRVTSGDVNVGPGGYAGLNGAWSWSAELAPLRAYRRPHVEQQITSFVKVNAHSILIAAPHVGVPAGSEAQVWLPNAAAQGETRATAPGFAQGDVRYRRVASAAGGLTVARWVADARSWWGGGCHFAEETGDRRWAAVVGRRSLLGPAWTMGNGLVDVAVDGGGYLAVRWWRPGGNGWTPTQRFGLGWAGGFVFHGWTAIEVVRNSPARVRVRLAPRYPSGGQGFAALTLELRRGSRTVSAVVDAAEVVPGHNVTPVPAVAVTDAGDHAYLTTAPADSSGFHWLVTAADDFTANAWTGVVGPANTLARKWAWGLSAYFDGAAGDTGNRTQTALGWYVDQTDEALVGVVT